MFVRTATSIVGLPVVVAAAWFGGAWLLILLAVVALLGLWEFSRLTAGMGGGPGLVLMAAGSLALLLNAYLGWGRGDVIIGASALALLSWMTFRAWASGPVPTGAETGRALPPHQGAALSWALALSGVLYLGWTLPHAILLRGLPDGGEWLVTAAAVVFATDTAAYLVGRAVGRLPMAPGISPRKTWEGALGGVAGGIAAAVGLTAAFALPVAWWQAVLLGGSITLAAEVGDLAESLLKRASGAGASGRLFPGHGGILDRLDSMAFGIVVGYYFVTWVVT